jgi:hypothetical protein
MGVTLVLITVLLMAAFSAAAQTIIYTKENMHEIPEVVTPNSKITELKYNPKLLGTNYLDEEWSPADIILYGDTIEIQGVDARIDLSNGILELNLEDRVIVVPSYRTKSILFSSSDNLYMSRSGIGLYGPAGFYRVLYTGKSALYCHYSTDIRESNYNVALDAGRKDDEIIHVLTYYLAKGDKLIKLEKKKGKLIDQLGGSKLEAYIKENSIDVRKEEGLISVVEFLDGTR